MSHSDSYSLQLNQPWLKWRDSGIQRLGHLSNALSLKHLCTRLTGRASDCGATHTFWWPEIQNLRESANCWWGYRADRSGGLWASLCWVFVITGISSKSHLEVVSWFCTHWQWKEVWQTCTQVSDTSKWIQLLHTWLAVLRSLVGAWVKCQQQLQKIVVQD